MLTVVDLVKRASERTARAKLYYDLPSAVSMSSAIDLAIETGFLGVIVGGAGIGKTTTLKAYAAAHAGVSYLCMNTAHASLHAFMTDWCRQAVGCSDHHVAEMLRLLMREASSRRLRAFLFDEAQNANPRIIEAVRAVYDQTGVVAVFAGNPSLRDRFDNRRAASFAQVTSRVGPRLDLPEATKEDAVALVRGWGVQEPDAIDRLERLRGGHSGLRRVAKALEICRRIAGDGEITLDHVKESELALGGAR